MAAKRAGWAGSSQTARIAKSASAMRPEAISRSACCTKICRAVVMTKDPGHADCVRKAWRGHRAPQIAGIREDPPDGPDASTGPSQINGALARAKPTRQTL